jgi:hypothetical protein
MWWSQRRCLRRREGGIPGEWGNIGKVSCWLLLLDIEVDVGCSNQMVLQTWN